MIADWLPIPSPSLLQLDINDIPPTQRTNPTYPPGSTMRFRKRMDETYAKLMAQFSSYGRALYRPRGFRFESLFSR